MVILGKQQTREESGTLLHQSWKKKKKKKKVAVQSGKTLVVTTIKTGREEETWVSYTYTVCHIWLHPLALPADITTGERIDCTVQTHT